MTRPDEGKTLGIPPYLFKFAAWLIGVALVIVVPLVAWDFSWRNDLTSKVAPIPRIQQDIAATQEDIREIKHDFSEHVGDNHRHPNLDKLSVQIENLDRRIQERATSVDKKLDSIDTTTQRQWEAISEIRKRGVQ